MIVAVLLVLLQGMPALPPAVKTDLDAWCGGWRLAPVIPEVAAEIGIRTPEWPANLIRGDFDGNGEADVALLAECTRTGRSLVHLLAFLARGAGFARFELEKPDRLDERQFLHLIIGKSSRGFGRDVIGVEFYTLGGHAWIYKDETWQLVPEPLGRR